MAGEARAGISARQTYVGVPVTLQIQFSDVSEHEPPELPQVDGLKVESSGPPSHSQRQAIINGRRFQSESLIYTFEVTPQREGEFVVPGISVSYDDRRQLLRGFRLVAEKSDTGDLMEVSVEAEVSSAYVGEALDLQLNIWVLPYRNEERQITLSEGQMWQLVSERSEWGIFSERMEEIAQQNQRPVGREVTREDSDGNPKTYYLYTIETTLYPKRPGTINDAECRVVMNYPSALGHRRSPLAEMLEGRGFPSSGLFGDSMSPFGARLAITSARPITAAASIRPIDVQAIPTNGRPSDYRGAVGRYRMIAQVKPHDAKVGDPITLHLAVAGDGPMDLVQAPPLAELNALTADFKVADEPLAGLVQGDTKLFSTTIRPRSADVDEVPAIPFSFFDPEQERFVTVHSDPVPITVEPAETLSLDQVVGKRGGRETPDDQPSADEQTDRPLALTSVSPVDPLVVSEKASWVWPWTALVWLVVPPVLVGIAFLISRRRRWAVWSAVLSSADRQLARQIEDATSAAALRKAVLVWIGRKTGRDPSHESAAIGSLRTTGRRELALRCERVLDRCRRADAGVLVDDELKLDRLKVWALTVLEKDQTDIPRNERAARSAPKRPPGRAFTAGLILFAMGVASPSASLRADQGADPASDFSPSQQAVLIDEALELHRQALSNGTATPAEGRAQAEAAAAKYQALIDGGVVNPMLLLNKAGAEYQAGHTGQAIADYRRVLHLAPDNRSALEALRFIESDAGLADATTLFSPAGLPTELTEFVRSVTHWVPAWQLRTLAIVAWLVLWGTVALRIRTFSFPWKSIVAGSLLIFLATATIYSVHRQQWTQAGVAIVISPELTLRAGDGESFSAVSTGPVREGMAVRVQSERNGWTKVQLDETTSGWVRSSSLATI